MKSLLEKLTEISELGGTRKEISFLIISGVSLLISIFDLLPLPFDAAWIAIILCGVPIIAGAVIGLLKEFDIKADVLVSLALIASILIGENFAAGEVAFIMQLGALLEELTVSKARAGIEKLVNLTPTTARVINGQKERVLPAKEVETGNLLRVLPGETIPVDGIIVTGQTSINQAVMTGESLPVDKVPGDEVSSGTVNQFGVFEMQATKVGEDSSIQRMIRLVQSADAQKAKIVGIADRWATWIVVIALISAGLTWVVTGEIIRAVTILVVFCPCALVLATPTAIMAAIGNATRHGFLVKEGDALERLAEVTKIAFDKTGTLTYGMPKVVCVRSHSADHTDDELYRLAASVEQFSEHPLGKAVATSYQREQKDSLLAVSDFMMIPGQGVCAKQNKLSVLVGNKKLFQEEQVVISDEYVNEAEQYLKKGSTLIYVSVDFKYVGYLALSDTIRKESREMIGQIMENKVQPVLLTGDHKNAAGTIAEELGISHVFAECLPEDKLRHIEEYQKVREKVCMIGDGVNDAPALKKADVGIAMGGIGSDIAVDAADIALVNDDVKELPHLIALSKRMMFTIKCNLSFSMALNFLAIALAITGILNPVFGALVHNAGSVVVITNSALLLKWRKKA
jgi:heavy metal translocating P-type ATPase